MEATIVLYPSPGTGHLVSMVELGQLILSRYESQFSVIILLTTGYFGSPSTTSYIDRISKTTPSITFHRLLHLPFTPSPHLPGMTNMYDFLNLNSSNVLQSLQQISETSSIRALIVDSLCASAFPLGRSLGISTYFYISFSTAALAAVLYLPTLHKQTTKSFKDLPNTVLSIPGLPPVLATQLMEPILDREDRSYQEALQLAEYLLKCDGILENSFEALDPTIQKAIANGECTPEGLCPPVYNVGPLITSVNKDASTIDPECLSWLDQQPSRSVVLLSFGSRGSFSREDVKEIANGVEGSGVRFLWVLRIPSHEGKERAVKKETTVWDDFNFDDVLPEGFLERTKNRGLVVKSWVAQAAVLGHQSVGGFVTHCGWNSMLEAVTMGVPMVAWSRQAEQHVNKLVLVEQMKLGIPLEKREEDGFFTGAELERRLRQLMDPVEGRELRERANKMREMALEALGEEGSSTAALAKLAYSWMHNQRYKSA